MRALTLTAAHEKQQVEVEREAQPDAVHLVVVDDGRIVIGRDPVAFGVSTDELDVKLLEGHALDGDEALELPVVTRVTRRACCFQYVLLLVPSPV